jgi:hypothetical protein
MIDLYFFSSEIPRKWLELKFRELGLDTYIQTYHFKFPYGIYGGKVRTAISYQTLEIPGRVVGMFGSVSEDPSFKLYPITLSPHVHQSFTSAAQLVYQRPSGVWIACD